MTTATSGDQRATPPERGTTASRDLSDDAIGALDGYGIEECHLVGVSFGGYLAQLVALKHPSRMLTLTLIASEPPVLADPDLPSIDHELHRANWPVILDTVDEHTAP